MKYLLTFLLIFITSQLPAQSVIPKSKLGKSTDGLTIHSSIKKCEDQYNEPCIKLNKKPNLPYMVLEDIMVQDIESPIFAKGQVESCETKELCQEALKLKECEEGDAIMVIDTTPMEVYCKILTGYKLKDSGRDRIVEDEDLKTQYLQKQAQKEAKKLAKEQRKERREEAKEALLDALMLDDQGNELTKKEIKKNLRALKKAVKDKKPKK